MPVQHGEFVESVPITPDPQSDLPSPHLSSSQFEISIYQIAADEMFRARRTDGAGWDWSWAKWQREWMDQTPGKYAYRCLPLTIANQTGWWVYNPVGFTAVWSGKSEPGGVQFLFDSDQKLWSNWISDIFGSGIITWNTPFLFRTKPEGSRLLICGPINYFKHGVQPLTAIIESDWMSMSFTMNWKLTEAGAMVRFAVGEPLFQVIPLAGNLGADLETAAVRYMKLADDPEVAEAFEKWKQSRTQFHQLKKAGEVKPDGWQKDYFQGQDLIETKENAGHRTKLTPPKIDFQSGMRP